MERFSDFRSICGSLILPLPMRTVFDLFTNQQFTLEEVAIITTRSIKDVEKLLKQARKALQVSLFNRYSIE